MVIWVFKYNFIREFTLLTVKVSDFHQILLHVTSYSGILDRKDHNVFSFAGNYL